MDNKYLIAAVFENSPIWDRYNKLHNNRSVVDKCWKKISKEMNVHEAKLRKKWKYLRYQFSVECCKIQQMSSGDSGHIDTTTKWPYFQSLLFLKDVIKPTRTGYLNKASTSTSPKYNEDTESQASLLDHEDNISSMPLLVETGTQPLPSEHYSSVLSRKRSAMLSAGSSNDTLRNIDKEMLQFLQEKNRRIEEDDKEDEHVLFLKSILPHVRKIPNHRLLSFRSRVQELVQQFAYEMFDDERL